MRLLRASLFSDAFALEPARVVVPQASERVSGTILVVTERVTAGRG